MAKMKLNFLFLGIDGVLNPNRVRYAFGDYNNLSLDTRNDKGEIDLSLFDAVALEFFRRLCSKYDIKIVLTSS